MARLHAHISVTDMPEVIARLRREMGLLLRDAAQHERPAVQDFAARMAAAFEVGVTTVRPGNARADVLHDFEQGADAGDSQ